ncbi:hypothetical protein FsymDg_4225 [Candidatus Protofrankia datiscae]|uniref:Uncharacterized protein n=1 Tax=Candidatus Protofrankia datiscae TaxID=2716812 RepID=F8AXS1_9ACTN|nr:hypothetical protein FsymDg_4225 [Candidatus Protofrankia datiscae]
MQLVVGSLFVGGWRTDQAGAATQGCEFRRGEGDDLVVLPHVSGRLVGGGGHGHGVGHGHGRRRRRVHPRDGLVVRMHAYADPRNAFTRVTDQAVSDRCSVGWVVQRPAEVSASSETYGRPSRRAAT